MLIETGRERIEMIHLGMRVPAQDIPIVNNHPINFERRIWPKSHPHAGSFLAKIHGTILFRFDRENYRVCLRYSQYYRMDSFGIDWCDDRSLFRYDLARIRTTCRCRCQWCCHWRKTSTTSTIVIFYSKKFLHIG